MEVSWSEALDQIYSNPEEPGSFSGPTKLQFALKSKGYNVSKYKINKWLYGKNSYSLFKQNKKSFARNNITVAHINELFQADLFEISGLAKSNDGVRYIMIVIDVFSRYIWIRPLHDKKPKTVAQAFEDVLSEGRICANLQTDSGMEFKGNAFKKIMIKHNINHYFSLNEKKCCYIERVGRTVKDMIFRYLEEKNTENYTSELQNFAYGYNHMKHRTIGIPPAMVTPGNESLVFWSQYWPKQSKKNVVKKSLNKKKHSHKFKFKIGETVRIIAINDIFSKSGSALWTGEIFRVKRRWFRDGIQIYTLCDFYEKEDIRGTFYSHELNHVVIKENEEFKIERIVKKRGKHHKKEALVKWRYWPKKFNSWVKLSEITNI